MKRTSRFKNTNWEERVLHDEKIEVSMQNIDNNPDAIYEMVVHENHGESKEFSVFFDDDDTERPQKLFKVHYNETAPVHSAMRDAMFSPGDTVEVNYRVDQDSRWGWWTATIKETTEKGYIVEFPDKTFGEEEVSWNLVRKQTFFL